MTTTTPIHNDLDITVSVPAHVLLHVAGHTATDHDDDTITNLRAALLAVALQQPTPSTPTSLDTPTSGTTSPRPSPSRPSGEAWPSDPPGRTPPPGVPSGDREGLRLAVRTDLGPRPYPGVFLSPEGL